MARLSILGAVLVLAGLSEAAFLPDYEYIEGVGWLRLHIVPASWPDAQLRCHLEDATLTAPTTSAITAVMKTTMRAHRLAEGRVFTDLHASNPKGDFTSINGLPMSNITLQWAVGEPDNLGNEEDCLVMTGAGELADVSCSSVHPFFCLKRNATSNCDQCDNTYRANECDNVPQETQCNTAHNENECNCTTDANQCSTTQEANQSNNTYNENECNCPSTEANQCSTTPEPKQCDTAAPGYTLEPRTGSCYKFHRTALPWYRAAMKCAAERAHLAVINSEEEARVIEELYNQNPSFTFRFPDADYAHIGILDGNKSGQWLTVLGETLDEADFNPWESGQPNGSGIEYCGAVSSSAKAHDIPCSTMKLPYICEISPR